MEGDNGSQLTVDIVASSIDQAEIYKENDVVKAPMKGMTFDSVEEVRSYYQMYANQEGFGIMTRNSKKETNGKVKFLVLACCREGRKRSKKKICVRNVPSVKQECEARINVKLSKDGVYQISTVVLSHNHAVSPSKARLFRNNIKIDMSVARKLELNDRAGVRINKSFRSLVVEAGGYENLTFREKDIRNYIEKQRRAIVQDGDGDALDKYFVRMQEQNNNFFYAFDFDESMRVTAVFWADARSRAAYESFGDVVTFDTTYLTNKYDMPFAAFVGVNHHGQSILLGCGLLSSEDTNSFVWLFQTWMHCMNGVPPKGIITDQCAAMRKAIEEVFPSTRHRWCLWHIMKKFPEKLGSYVSFKAIIPDLHNAIYDSLTIDEFELHWKKIIEDYDLENNEWLKGLFLERHRWVPAFVKDGFWAGMSTTQRSESMHAFFDGYVHSQTTLKQFVDQYDNALQDKAEKEFEADFRSFSSNLTCITNSPFERQFQVVYTHKKFLEVQKEFSGKADCTVRVTNDECCIYEYSVLEDVIIAGKARKAMFKVTFDRNICDVKCSCHLFEFKGIICRHSLAILSQEQVIEVPRRYILDRWSKTLKRRYTLIKSSYDVKQLKPQMQRFDVLTRQFDDVAQVACEFEETSDIVKNTLSELRAKVEALTISLRDSNNQVIPLNNMANDHMLDKDLDSNSKVLTPNRVRRKGRPPSKRKMSTVEKIVQRQKKKMDGKKMVDNLHSGEAAECNISIRSSSCCNQLIPQETSQHQDTLFSQASASTLVGSSEQHDSRASNSAIFVGNQPYFGHADTLALFRYMQQCFEHANISGLFRGSEQYFSKAHAELQNQVNDDGLQSFYHT